MERKVEMIDQQILMQISEFFVKQDAPEVFEVVMYALASITLNDLTTQAVALGKTSVEGLPPEAVVLVKRFDDGLVKNQFWAENYVPIKSQLILDNVKLETLLNYQRFFDGQKEKDINLLKQMRAIVLSRFDVLTTIAFYYKGIDFANEFDAKFRHTVQLKPEMQALFEKYGLGA
jgi:hypothetical protein